MNGALDALRTVVAEQLRRAGLNAVTAMESTRANRWRGAVAAISLSRVACVPGGFQDYLGTRADPKTGIEREFYGRKAELTLALDIYAPREGGERTCQRAAAKLAEELLCRGAAGLPVLELETGRVEFLEREGLYRQPVSCRCGAWLVARMDEGRGAFADFEVRGRVT